MQRDLGVLMDSKLTMRQQCVLVAKKVVRTLGSFRKNIPRTSREMILPLCSALVRHIWNAVSNSGFPSRRHVELLERVQQKARLRDWSVFHKRRG